METNNKTAPVTGQQDQNTISLDLMNRMKLHGMAEAFKESLAGTTPQSMTADTFLSMLLAREWDYRAQATIARLTKNAAFRYKSYLEQIDYATNRGLERNQMERLATLDFVHKGQNLFITGSSGTGKSYLACALGHEAWALSTILCKCKRDSVISLLISGFGTIKEDSELSMPMLQNCLAH